MRVLVCAGDPKVRRRLGKPVWKKPDNVVQAPWHAHSKRFRGLPAILDLREASERQRLHSRVVQAKEAVRVGGQHGDSVLPVGE